MSKKTPLSIEESIRYKVLAHDITEFGLASIKKLIEQEDTIGEGRAVLQNHFDGLDLTNEKIWSGIFDEMNANDVMNVSNQELKHLVYKHFQSERDSWLKHDTTTDLPLILAKDGDHTTVITSPIYSTLDCLFLDEEEIKPCIHALQSVSPCIVDSKLNYLLGVRGKSAIAVWVKVLKEKGKIKPVNDQLMAELLNNKFNNLKLGVDGKTLRAVSMTAKNKYHKQFLGMIA